MAETILRGRPEGIGAFSGGGDPFTGNLGSGNLEGGVSPFGPDVPTFFAPEEPITQQTYLLQVEEKEALRKRMTKKATEINASSETLEKMLRRRGVDEASINSLRNQASKLAPKPRKTFKGADGFTYYTPEAPGAPAVRVDPSIEKASAVTGPQSANNAEIDRARQIISQFTKEDIKDRITEASARGRANPNYDPTLEATFKKAAQRKVGDDPDFENFSEIYSGSPHTSLPQLAEAEAATHGGIGAGPGAAAPASSRGRVVQTGTAPDGRRLIQYEDGTVTDEQGNVVDVTR